MIILNDSMCNLEQFKQRSDEDDNGAKYEYFVTLINLFADLCL